MFRIWWLYDAKYQCPFRSAKIIAGYLQGQHKPIYHALCKNTLLILKYLNFDIASSASLQEDDRAHAHEIL